MFVYLTVFINFFYVCVDRPFAASVTLFWSTTLINIDVCIIERWTWELELFIKLIRNLFLCLWSFCFVFLIVRNYLGPFWNVLTLLRRVRRRRRRIFPGSSTFPVALSWSPLYGAVAGAVAGAGAGGSVCSFWEPSSDKPVVQDAAAWKKCFEKKFKKKLKTCQSWKHVQ